nr:keratin, type I cytoskeletal 9-like [Aegilops tauschii subsp. strangulata]
MSHQIDLKTSACTMAAAGGDDDWVYIDGDQETKAPAVVCASDSLDESEHCAFDLKLLADLDYLARKKDSRIRMDGATEVVAAADAAGDGAADEADAAEDEDDCPGYSNGGRLEKDYESDQDLGQVEDESERHEDGTSDLRLRGLLDNLKTIESKLLDCQRELLDCQKSIQDHRKATRDESAPAPAPAPSAHGYNARPAAYIAGLSASSYTSYDGYRSGGYGTSSGYDANGYGGGGYDGGLSDYDYGGGRGGYYRGISGYDYGGLGYYYYLLGYDYGMGGRGGYGIGFGHRYGGGGGYGGILDYGYRYGRNVGHYFDFDYGGLGDNYSGSSGNSYGYRPEDYGGWMLSLVVTDARGAGGGA